MRIKETQIKLSKQKKMDKATLANRNKVLRAQTGREIL